MKFCGLPSRNIDSREATGDVDNVAIHPSNALAE